MSARADGQAAEAEDAPSDQLLTEPYGSRAGHDQALLRRQPHSLIEPRSVPDDHDVRGGARLTVVFCKQGAATDATSATGRPPFASRGPSAGAC